MNSNPRSPKHIPQRPSPKVNPRILVRIMSKPIPLRTTLRIKLQRIIIHLPRRFIFDRLSERCAPKARSRHCVQWPVCGDADTLSYFLSGSTDFLWG